MELVKQKRVRFCNIFYFWRKFFEHLWFISIYNVLNKDSKYLYFYISKNIISYTFLLVFKRVFLKPLTNRPPTTNHLLIEQPITYLRPPTNRPPSKCTDHRPTDHLPIRNMTTRNSITNFRWISDKMIRDRVINATSRMWVTFFGLKPECAIEKIKSLNVKLINYKTCGNCIWKKR